MRIYRTCFNQIDGTRCYKSNELFFHGNIISTSGKITVESLNKRRTEEVFLLSRVPCSFSDQHLFQYWHSCFLYPMLPQTVYVINEFNCKAFYILYNPLKYNMSHLFLSNFIGR